MQTLWQFTPFILMLLVFYGIYRYKKSRNKNKIIEVGKPVNLAWKKARIVLYILMIFLLVYESRGYETGGEIRIIATIINFFISKEIFLYYDNKSFIQNYPKISIVGISIGVFIIQVLLVNFLLAV